MMTLGTPRLSTTFTALPDVQVMSHSAFTAAEVFDVDDDRHAGMGRLQHADVGRRDRFRQRAAGAHVRDENGTPRVKQLGRFGHEVDAGEDDHIRIALPRHAGECERVADEVGDAVENLRRLVVVRGE